MDRDTKDRLQVVVREMKDVLARLEWLCQPREYSVFIADAELDRAIRAADRWTTQLRLTRALLKAYMRRRRADAGASPTAVVDMSAVVREIARDVVDG